MAWQEFEERHLPTTLTISRGEKLFQPYAANYDVVNARMLQLSLRYTTENLERVFNEVFSQLAHIDPRRDYETKTIDAEGHRQPIPQNKLSVKTQIAAGQPVLPVEIGPAEIRNASAGQIRAWIRRFGSTQINARLNGRG